MGKWDTLGQAFENIGMNLRVECLNMAETCQFDDAFEVLYTNYVQLLESIKSQRQVIDHRFEQLDEREED